MIETAKQQERAILVGVELQETEHFDMSMEELASLAKTAGAEVVASYTQKREVFRRFRKIRRNQGHGGCG